MSRHPRITPGLPAAVALALMLAACAAPAPGPETQDAAPADPALPAGMAEDPEFYSRTGRALWDGRPTLGGVWIAHPDVSAPQRVVIRDQAAGTAVSGALFRRESPVGGDLFQLSSDAADALGMSAGAPATLRVVALAPRSSAPAAAQEGDAPARTAAALAGLPPVREPATAAATGSTRGATTGIRVRESAGETPAAAPAGAVPATAGAIGRAAQDPVRAAASDATAPDAGALPGRALQIATFGREANADAALARLAAAGVGARKIAGGGADNPLWQVVAGPARDATAASRLLANVKAAGFADAYFLPQ